MKPDPHPPGRPCLVYANKHGEIKDFPGLDMAGRSGTRYFRPETEDLIPLPEGSELFILPDRFPIGIDQTGKKPIVLDQSPDDPEESIQAVAAFMAPAYTAIYSAACQESGPELPPLPLFAYTAVGWYRGRFWVSGFRSDPDIRQDLRGFNLEKIQNRTQKSLLANKRNRLIQHLGKCCLTYGCPAARNYFLGRYEAPLPTSPACNADCVGCISLQTSGCCPATQDRISFVPTAREIAEVAVPHLKNTRKGIVSFGQGCEGEPLLQAKTIEKAIHLIRRQTEKGTINLNTNASLPTVVDQLSKAGLDSIRVSMNSARKEYHRRYYRPRGFSLDNVLETISVMKSDHKFVSLNYFILPGFTDDPDEFEAFCTIIEQRRPDLIQLRNLNMDPDWYCETVGHRPDKNPLGMRIWLSQLKKLFPFLKFGYFNPPLR